MMKKMPVAVLAVTSLVLAAALLVAGCQPSPAFAALSHGFDPSALLLGGFTLAALQQRRSALLADLEKLVATEPTDETRAAFDKVESDLKKVDEDIKRAQSLETLRRNAAQIAAEQQEQQRSIPGGGGGDGGSTGMPGFLVPAAPEQRRNYGWEMGAMVRSYAIAQMHTRDGTGYEPPVKIASGLYGEQHPVVGMMQRAQTVSSGPGGGFAVPMTHAPEIIQGFNPLAIVRPLCRVVPGNAVYLRGLGGVVCGYVGENEQPKLTGVTFGLMEIGEKDFGAILPLSKKLLRNTGAHNVEAYCRDELTEGGSRWEDQMFLSGSGTGKQVQGLMHAIPQDHRFDAAASGDTPNHADARKWLRKILAALATANVPVGANTPAWLMHPVVKMYLEDLYVGDVKAFPTLESEAPTLMGYPVKTSTQLPGPGDAGGSVIIFGCFRLAMIGDTVSMALTTSDQASVVDANGTVINLWAQEMLGIKLLMSHDFALRHPKAFGLLSGITWGK